MRPTTLLPGTGAGKSSSQRKSRGAARANRFVCLTILAFTGCQGDHAPGGSIAAGLSVGSMAGARSGHTAAPLGDGRVLVAGGGTAGAEIFDPVAGKWSTAGSMSVARTHATALLLPTGKVLVLGGEAGTQTLATGEAFNGAANTWSKAATLSAARAHHSSTLLRTGKVLVAGGRQGASKQLASCELYDPATGKLSQAGAMTTPRSEHTAVLLQDGDVLACGGQGGAAALASCERYSATANAWFVVASMTSARRGHSATVLGDGRILVSGGVGAKARSSAELYDASTGKWSATGSLAQARASHSSTLLSWGGVAVAGGANGAVALTSVEVFHPGTGKWTASSSLAKGRARHTATLLPDGKVLVAGGSSAAAGPGLSSAEAVVVPAQAPWGGRWVATGSHAGARRFHRATLLPSGKVLITGGCVGTIPLTLGALATAEIYDPVTGKWSFASNMSQARILHSVTLLKNGKVLVAGGGNGGYPNLTVVASAELFDPSSGKWTSTNPMKNARSFHTATMLPSGKVLTAGGARRDPFNPLYDYSLDSAEIYDPSTGTWTPTGSLTKARYMHAATLLPSGDVLVSGGGTFTFTTSAVLMLVPFGDTESYNPTSGTWTARSALGKHRVSHTTTLLSSGKVLAAGGGSTYYEELYDPSGGKWSQTGVLSYSRTSHTATMLPSGLVLVAGGGAGSGSAELYQPLLGKWSWGGKLVAARTAHSATLLKNGDLLLAGGGSSDFSGPSLTAAELYQLLPLPAARPYLLSTPASASPGQVITLKGAGLRGLGETGSGGTQSSATDHPMVRLAAGTMVSYLAGSQWSRSQVEAALPCALAPGPYSVSIIVNGRASNTAKLTVVAGCYCAATKCDDKDPCTRDDICDGKGGCAGVAYGCSAGACEQTSVCDGKGACATTYLTAGAKCDDGSACTKGDVCDAKGGCAGTAYSCSPGICEQASVCDGKGGCTPNYQAAGSACDDGDACTKGDACDSKGGCTGAKYGCVPVGCQKTSACDGKGGCSPTYLAAGSACDDGDACTKGDVCDGKSGCAGTAYVCAPGKCDKTSVCDGKGGCSTTYQAAGSTCDDGDACTKNDVCDGKGGCAGAAYGCSPGKCEQASACDGKGGCSHTYQAAGATCDDGDACTKGDVCDAKGGCAGTTYSCAPGKCEQASACDGKGGCVPTLQPDGEPCDDRNPCTRVDLCKAGACTGTSPVSCPAQGPCYEVGVCDPKTKLCDSIVKPDDAPCPGGTCLAGVCQPSDEGGCGCQVSLARSSGYPILLLGLLLIRRVGRRRAETPRRVSGA